MPRPTLEGWLTSHGAHHDVVLWATPYGDDWRRSWHECPRGDWLLAMAARLGVERPRLVLAAAAAARTALESLTRDEPRPRAALELCEAWARGDAPVEACRERATELARWAPADPTESAVAAACLAALLSVDDADAAAGAAANAAQAALFGAGDCGLMALLSYSQRLTADRVREHVPFELVDARLG